MTFYCLGDLMVDVVARLFGPLVEGSDSPGVISYVGGGSAANTAAWLTRVGVDSVFIGSIGDDPAGQGQLESLHALGVDVRFRVDRIRPTGTCLVLVAPTGERTMVPDPGANLSLMEHDVPTDEFRAGDHLHVSGYALLRDSRDAAVHAMQAARGAGMTISVGAASSSPLALAGPEVFLGLLPDDVLLFANEAEAAVLAGGSGAPADLARTLAVAGRRAVVTAGSSEAAWSDGDEVVALGAEPLDRPELDTTGAGDAFAAGFLAARGRDASPAVCLRDGHVLAAAACRTTGGRPS
ncbi:carbohydrate kinase family protein [Nocardioides cynanchi]|uniref:carbohydrate kinase family protein n=1 Tax=Nocardioides cynanchi TaxID=2558918 RepID=UPI0012488DAF|nr:carbohydrate kinase family protein [Nocardioides cynanchi]